MATKDCLKKKPHHNPLPPLSPSPCVHHQIHMQIFIGLCSLVHLLVSVPLHLYYVCFLISHPSLCLCVFSCSCHLYIVLSTYISDSSCKENFFYWVSVNGFCRVFVTITTYHRTSNQKVFFWSLFSPVCVITWLFPEYCLCFRVTPFHCNYITVISSSRLS